MNRECPERATKFPLSPRDLSRLGSGERNLGEAKGPQGPSKRERASHWAGVRGEDAKPTGAHAAI